MKVFRRPEGVHSEAGYRRHSGGGFLPEGRHQPSDLLQLEKEIRRQISPFRTGPSRTADQGHLPDALAIGGFTFYCGVGLLSRSNKTRRIYRETGLQLRTNAEEPSEGHAT